MGDNLCQYTYDILLTHRTYKENKQERVQEANTSIKPWTRDLNRVLTRRNTNRQEIFQTLTIILCSLGNENQNNIPARMANIKNN